MVTPNKDDDYLDRLRDYYAENRRIPSMQRIAEPTEQSWQRWRDHDRNQ